MKTKSALNLVILFVSFITLSACDRLEKAFEHRVNTQVDATVINHGSDPLLVQAFATQNYDANHCTNNGQARTSIDVNPGESNHVFTSIECNAKVQTWLNVQKQTTYKLASMPITSQAAVKLGNTAQLRLTDKNGLSLVAIQWINPLPDSGSYDQRWSLSPTGNANAAWLKSEKVYDGDYYGRLYFSIPAELNAESYFIEFDHTFVASDFGKNDVQFFNGQYRAKIHPTAGPMLSLHIEAGAITCDDVGCRHEQ